MKKLFFILSTFIISATMFAKQIEINSKEDLNQPGIIVGSEMGSASQIFFEKQYPGVEIQYLLVDAGLLSIHQNKINGYIFDESIIKYQIGINQLKGLKLVRLEDLPHLRIAGGISRLTKIPDLREKYNEFLQLIKKDGTFEEMHKYWFVDCMSEPRKIEKAANPKGVLKVGTTGNMPPYTFFNGTESIGFDIELNERFAAWLGYDIQFKVYDFPGLIAAIATGQIDSAFSNLNWTEERAKKIDYTEPYFYHEIVLVCADYSADYSALKNSGKITKLEQLAGKKIAVQTGTTHDSYAEQQITKADIKYYQTSPDCFVALEKGKVDAMVTDRIVYEVYNEKNPGKVYALEEKLNSDEYGYIARKNSPFMKEFDAVLKKMNEKGEIQEIVNKWCSPDDSIRIIPKKDWKGSRGKLRIAGSADFEPVYFIKDNKIAGFDVEILSRIAKEMDYDIEFMNVDCAAITNMLNSNKADIGCSGLGNTPERKAAFDFSETYYDGSAIVLVKNNSHSVSDKSAIEKIKESFEKNFIRESRWKLLLSGLKITVLISVLSLIFGLMIGFVLCMIRRMDKLPSNIFTGTFVRLIQGMPTVVLLMILYYIIFGSIDISGIVVAVIGFSINFGAYASEILRSGMNSVEKGQIEAACALGYSKLQIFMKIILPQAAVNFIPVLKGEFISMVKMTSIVGYIAISDLTKASDIIRSRTMEAFFPLIMTAVIYFIIAWLFTQILVVIEKKINPKQRKNILKGVVLKQAQNDMNS